MQRRILKYTINPNDLDFETNAVVVEMPMSAQILSIGVQDDEVRVWASVEVDDHETRYQKFLVLPTGLTEYNDNPRKGPAPEFLGTVILMGGALVFHIFTVGR